MFSKVLEQIKNTTNSVEPLVSVVVPTRNRSLLLARVLESVSNQKYSNLEVIIVDDASEDNTLSVVEGYRNRFRNIRCIHNNRRCGGAESRNTGIKHSTGEYIAFLDDDDEWLPEKIKKQVRALEDNQDIDAVSCWYNMISDNGKKRTGVRLVPNPTFESMLWENFLGGFSLCVVRSNLAKSIRLDPELRSSQDWNFWLEITRHAKVGIVGDYLVNYSDHSGKRISNSLDNKLFGLRRIYFKYRPYMTRDCRRYRLTYLILYRTMQGNRSLITRLARILKNKYILNNRISRFALKKTILVRLDRLLHINVYDPTIATYRYLK